MSRHEHRQLFDDLERVLWSIPECKRDHSVHAQQCDCASTLGRSTKLAQDHQKAAGVCAGGHCRDMFIPDRLKSVFRCLNMSTHMAACKCALMNLYNAHSVKLDEWTCPVAKCKSKGSSTYIWPPHNLRRIGEFVRNGDAFPSVCMTAEASHK